MRTIIPVAGNGLRLRPITNTKPKVLIEVAGKPVLSHIIQNMYKSGAHEIVFVVGYMKDTVIKWAKREFGDMFDLHFVTQVDQLGLGHAIYCAREYLDDDEVLIALGDEIFSRRYSSMLNDLDPSNGFQAAVGTKRVDDPTHYGMIKINKDNLVTEMVEKPNNYSGNLALAGVYYLKHGEDLLPALENLMSQDLESEEYQLTDALQNLVETGTKISTFDVGKWYDCGRLETLIASNRRLLEGNHLIHKSSSIKNSEIIEPCFIGPNTVLIDSQIGPYVSMGTNAKITDGYMNDAIIESNTSLSKLRSSCSVFSGNQILRNE